MKKCQIGLKRILNESEFSTEEDKSLRVKVIQAQATRLNNFAARFRENTSKFHETCPFKLQWPSAMNRFQKVKSKSKLGRSPKRLKKQESSSLFELEKGLLKLKMQFKQRTMRLLSPFLCLPLYSCCLSIQMT
jgi:hypothetical protein